MNTTCLQVLLIDLSEKTYVSFKDLFYALGSHRFQLHWASTYETGLTMIQKGSQKGSSKGSPKESRSESHDIYLISNRLQHHSGLDLLVEVRQHRGYVPVIILVEPNEDFNGVNALKAGASDYLVKNQIHPALLDRSLQYATIRSLIEQDMVQAKETAMHALHSRSEFIATFSAEIRAPIQKAKDLAEALQAKDLPEDKRQSNIQALISSIDTISGVVSDLMDFSKIELGKLKLDSTSFDPKMIINDTARLFSLPINQGGLELKLNISEEIPSVFYGDPGRLRQILSHLVGNALRYTKTGHIGISASLKDKSNLYIEISDTGPGIPQFAQRKIFELFVQNDPSGSAPPRKIEGTGIGLAICKKLVEMMRGAIGFKSEEGKGTTFWLSIPIKL